jgi:hypothetical protein
MSWCATDTGGGPAAPRSGTGRINPPSPVHDPVAKLVKPLRFFRLGTAARSWRYHHDIPL